MKLPRRPLVSLVCIALMAMWFSGAHAHRALANVGHHSLADTHEQAVHGHDAAHAQHDDHHSSASEHEGLALDVELTSVSGSLGKTSQASVALLLHAELGLLDPPPVIELPPGADPPGPYGSPDSLRPPLRGPPSSGPC